MPHPLSHPSSRATLSLLVVLGLFAGRATAQRNPLARVDKDLYKESPALLHLGDAVARSAAESTVQIFVGDDLVDLGTVVRPDEPGADQGERAGWGI